jgi:hypothetical protein
VATIDQETAARWLVLVLRLPAVEQHSAERFGALARATRRRVNLRAPWLSGIGVRTLAPAPQQIGETRPRVC